MMVLVDLLCYFYYFFPHFIFIEADCCKDVNKVNTSIKLPLRIKVKSSNEKIISFFETILKETDLIYDYFIKKFDSEYIVYEIIYNGTPDVFLKSMDKKKLNFDIQEKDWILR